MSVAARLVFAFCFSSYAGVLHAQVTIEHVFPSLSFTTPVDLQHAGDGSDRLFVVERAGTVHVFQNDDHVASSSVFLDIRDKVQEGVEEGLLGLAFHPEYHDNGRFFVYYTAPDPRRSVLASYRVRSDDPNAADQESEEIIIEIEQPFAGHNGGQIRFGKEGFLYIAVGDGGGHDDLLPSGEDLETLLATILRIDVDNPDAGSRYGIPEDNPFAGIDLGYREEIFAYGLRNPWRFSFDPHDPSVPSENIERLWVGDVGDGSYEEINLVESGKNYGWSAMEGARCHARFPDCSFEGRTLPVWEYGHHEGRAVIGGFVYRGSRVPFLLGEYVYGDYVSGRFWALTFAGGGDVENRELLHADTLRIHAFGEDEAGELMVLAVHAFKGGGVYRLAMGDLVSPGTGREELPETLELTGNYPNPFRNSTVISYSLMRPARVQLSVYDVMGRRIGDLVDDVQVPGSQAVRWDGRSDTGEYVTPGIYLYRITVDGMAAGSGRMVFLR